MTLEVGGRKAQLTHVNNAHTDGDTWVYFADANVLATGDTFTNGRYPTIDFANGGNIRGMIARDRHLSQGSPTTRPRSCPATARSRTRPTSPKFHAMLTTARDRIEKLVKEGKSEDDVIAANAARRLRRQVRRERAAEQELDPRGLQLAEEARSWPARYFTPSNSTSNISVAFGGMAPPAPRAP